MSQDNIMWNFQFSPLLYHIISVFNVYQKKTFSSVLSVRTGTTAYKRSCTHREAHKNWICHSLYTGVDFACHPVEELL